MDEGIPPRCKVKGWGGEEDRLHKPIDRHEDNAKYTNGREDILGCLRTSRLTP